MVLAGKVKGGSCAGLRLAGELVVDEGAEGKKVEVVLVGKPRNGDVGEMVGKE